jgi:hypothetical protein
MNRYASIALLFIIVVSVLFPRRAFAVEFSNLKVEIQQAGAQKLQCNGGDCADRYFWTHIIDHNLDTYYRILTERTDVGRTEFRPEVRTIFNFEGPNAVTGVYLRYRIIVRTDQWSCSGIDIIGKDASGSILNYFQYDLCEDREDPDNGFDTGILEATAPIAGTFDTVEVLIRAVGVEEKNFSQIASVEVEFIIYEIQPVESTPPTIEEIRSDTGETAKAYIQDTGSGLKEVKVWCDYLAVSSEICVAAIPAFSPGTTKIVELTRYKGTETASDVPLDVTYGLIVTDISGNQTCLKDGLIEPCSAVIVPGGRTTLGENSLYLPMIRHSSLSGMHP